MAVYDDVNGWQTDQYLGNAEFYMGYGNYDVALTVPAGWLVDATGRLQNAAEVLSAQTRARLDSAAHATGVDPCRHRGRPQGWDIHHRRDQRQAHLALSGRERARRLLGHLAQVSVGCHQRRGRRRQRRRPARHRRDLLLLSPRAAHQPLG